MNNVDYDKKLADLKAYCFEHLKTAYGRGYYDGIQISLKSNEDDLKNEYEKGLNDAWECARKINTIPFWELEDIFRCNPNDIYKMSASEAIAKIKEYEEKQKQTEDKNKTSEKQIGKSCMNCKYHVTNDYPYPNFCYLIRRGHNCTNFSAWESNVVEKLYSNEVTNND